MSGETAARALKVRFEQIRRTELERLRKKISGLSPAHRAEVEAITAQIVQAIAAAPERVLARGDGRLVQAVVDLFCVSYEREDLSAR